jgi:phosphomannomutase
MREVLKVGISGVRGVVGESFTPQVACSFAQAFGAFVGRGVVLVGRDTRPSGALMERAVVAGLQSVGCKPVLAGVVPTPSLLMLVRETGARGGILITASHNPAPWNALKFADGHGHFLSASRAEELFDLYHQQSFPLVAEADIPTVGQRPYPVDLHFEAIRKYVDTEAIRARRFKVAVDAVNGVGALYSAMLLQGVLGCEVVQIHDTPSGEFERDPEPLPAHLGRLGEVVRQQGCAIGFAQDPDGDRLTLVDEQGTALVEDLTLAFCVRQVLERHSKGAVVLNLSTSKCVEQVARSFGSEVTRSRIGETHVTAAMLQAGAVVGGESNGGVIIPAIHACRDSFAAMAVMLELMAHAGRTVSELRAEVPTYHLRRDKVLLQAGEGADSLRRVRRHYAGRPISLLDGVHVDFGDAWVHARRSNTESVLRITAEAPTGERADALVAEVRGLFGIPRRETPGH